MTVPAVDVCGVLLATDGAACADVAARLIASSLDPRGVAVEVVSVVPPMPRPPGIEGDRPALVEGHQLEAAERVTQGNTGSSSAASQARSRRCLPARCWSRHTDAPRGRRER